MRTFFSSDHHFGHANIIRYCNRPYRSASEMNYDMQRRWNATVQPGDRVWYLGDFAMGNPELWPAYLKGLNGDIRLILGNHDRSQADMLAVGFAEVHDNLIIEVDGYKLWLNHFPPAGDDQQTIPVGRRNYVRPTAPGPYDISLCGHVHEKWTIHDATLNVGVDRWNFTPIDLGTILQTLNEHATT